MCVLLCVLLCLLLCLLLCVSQDRQSAAAHCWAVCVYCCRAHVGVRLRDPGLDVSDINQYMLRKPIGRDVSPLAKGHPAGPRLVSPVKARCDPALQDNSLRTTDIEGCAPGRWG
jgi:hypothetical protein